MINKLTVTGLVIGTKPRESGTRGSITVAVKTAYRIRKKGQGENAVRDAYLIFYYGTGTKTKNIAKDFKVGDHVEIEAHTASYIRENANGSTSEIFNFHIDTIEHLKTEFEKTFGVSGGHYPTDNAVLCAEGQIAKITIINNKFIELRIDMSEGRKNFINVLAYDGFAAKVKNYQIGDKICFCAQIKTLSDDRRGSRDFNQFIVTGIAKDPGQSPKKKEKKKAAPKVDNPETDSERKVEPADNFSKEEA